MVRLLRWGLRRWSEYFAVRRFDRRGACGFQLSTFTLKYTYAYKTPDGIRHEDSMNASSREEVFEALRAKGIKAIKVVAADGSKANGEVRGVRKRTVAILMLLSAVLSGLAVFLLTRMCSRF